MIINNKHVQGIFLYSPDVEYEKGDFVVSGDSIYICTAANPTNPETFTVMGVNPETDSTGNYKVYPGDKISTVQEYYDYVNNRMYWNYKDTKEEVETALGVEAGGLIVLGTFSNRSDLPNLKKEGDVYRVGTPSTGYEYAYIPYKEDKYISGSVLNQILQDAFFGVNESGVITNHVYTETDDDGILHLDYSIGGTLANIEDDKILNAIMKSPDLNNGMFNVSRSLPEISGFINLDSTVETVLIHQYTYADNKLGNKRVRIQELVDPESSIVYYRWSEGIGVTSNAYDQNHPYHLNEVSFYNGKAWLSGEDNNIGHLPGTDESWWTEFSGEWSYENITAWTSTFSASASKISAQLDSIKAFYTKKVAELEATKKQLTGAFCNREVTDIPGDQSTATLTAGDNVRMHSSWQFIEGDEEDLLQKLQVSSLTDTFTLFSSTSQVDNLLNTINLSEIVVIVKVGTSNNFTYSYSKNGDPWQHGKTIANILSELGKNKLSDVFEVDSNIYTEFPTLDHPDFPFTIVLKNQVSGAMEISLYSPYSGTWDLTGKTLYDQSEINKRLSNIYYEDLANNDEIIGVAELGYANNINLLVGNTATVSVLDPGADDPEHYPYGDGPISRIPLPMILPIFNGESPFLIKSSFAEPLGYRNDGGSTEIPPYDQGMAYSDGSMVIDENTNKVYILRSAPGVEPGFPGPGEPGSCWMEYSTYIEMFNSWRSYYYGWDNEKVYEQVTGNLYDALTHPYGLDGGSIWESLVLGPAPKLENMVYPISTVIPAEGDISKFWKTSETMSGSDPEWDYKVIYLLPTGNSIGRYIPDYNNIFEVEEFKSSTAEAYNKDDGETILLKLNTSPFKYLSESVGVKKPTGFFCIIYPAFYEGGDIVRYLPDGSGSYDNDPFNKENAFYCLFDINDESAYLRSVNDFGKAATDEDLKRIVDEFLKTIVDKYSDLVTAIGTYVDNSSITNSINGNLSISDLGGLPKLNIYFNLGYRGGFESIPSLPVTYTSTIYDGNPITFSPITQGSPNYNNITFSNDVNGITAGLGVCTLITSKLWGDSINLILKLGLDPKKGYRYYISDYTLEYRDLNESVEEIGEPPIGDLIYDEDASAAPFFDPDPNVSYSVGDKVIYNNGVWQLAAGGNKEVPYPGSIKWQYLGMDYKYKNGRFGYIKTSGFTYFRIRTPFTGNFRSDISYIEGDVAIHSGTYKKFSGGAWVTGTGLDGALEVADTRLNVVLNKLETGNLTIEEDSFDTFLRVLLSFKTKFSYIVLTDGMYRSVRGGVYSDIQSFTPTNQNILEYADLISDTNILQETNKFYIPPTIVKDISLDQDCVEEYRIMYNTPSTRKNITDWITGAGPLERLLIDLGPDGEHAIPSVLEGITEISASTLVNYSIPIRTVCVEDRSVSNKIYYVNGNYWVRGTHPTSDSDYIKWNDNTDILGPIPPTFNDLPDSFNLGKIYVIFGTGNQSEEWYVVQNPDWLTIDLQNGEFYDKNRRANIKRWWTSTDRNYSCSEEVLFDILHTNFVINTSGNTSSNNPKYKGILWNSLYKYMPGDIVIYHYPYNSSSTYSIGDVVTNEGKMWKALENGITGAWNATKWEDMQLSDFSLWKCLTTTQAGAKPGATLNWEFYGDPLYNTLTYIPSKTVLLNNVNPSVPFNLITKVGSTSNYSIALNSRMTDFGVPCIATILLQRVDSSNLIHCYTATIDLYLGNESSVDYYITEDIILTVSSSEGDKKRVLTVTGGATIKNIYYRYTL